jgi:hypothetical protein
VASNWVRQGLTGSGWAICADAIEERGYSADGSYMAGTLVLSVDGYNTQGLQLIEGGDYGDCAPWVAYTPRSNTSPYSIHSIPTINRLNPGTLITTLYSDNALRTYTESASLPSNTYITGWLRRGFNDSFDKFMAYVPAIPSSYYEYNTSNTTRMYSIFRTPRTGTTLTTINQSDPSLSVTHEGFVPVLYPLAIGYFITHSTTSTENSKIHYKHFKGFFRWLKLIEGGHTNSLHDNTFLQCAGASLNIAIGPFNGVAPTLSSTRMYLTNDDSPTTPNVRRTAIVGSVYSNTGVLLDSASTIPANPGGSAWENFLDPQLRCNSLKRLPGRTVGQVRGSWTPTANATSGSLGFISAPLAAQTISGTVKGQLLARVTTVVVGIYIAARLYVITPQNTVRGVLRELLTNGDISGGTALTTTLTNRKIFRNDTLSPVIVQDNDRLVLEIGAAVSTVSTGVVVLDLMDNNNTDLPENESSTAVENSWVEFSNPPLFLNEKPEIPVLINGPSTIGGQGFTQVNITNYINRVYDSTAVGFITWITTFPDTTGIEYPGPGTFGVDTSDYAIAGTF